jgi:predicted ATPase/transcriptional regulator with XRE-family HTH domain
LTACDSFGDWLRLRRKSLDLTRLELATCVGSSVSALRKIESDERRPSKQLAELLAECLQIPPERRLAFLNTARGMQRVDLLGAPEPEIAAVTVSSPPSHTDSSLPISSLPLIGREAELDTLSRLLSDSQCRLLTLIGPGGIGKTRLALEVAARQERAFTDGVFFAPLASISSTEFLISAIAEAVDLSFQGAVDARTSLFNYLRQKQMLLVLDNVEHLLDAGGLISEILEQVPRIKLLVTSRERLRLQEEWVFGVEGLPIPPMTQTKDDSEHNAVALFIQSARRTNVTFELQPADWRPVVRICQMVGGMPLGIELAAAWVQILSCGEIANEIERSLDFLATSMRDVPERQRSLKATFDHSWSLLSSDERSVLCQLAVFQGHFDRRASEQIAGADLPLLSALVSKSLVRRTENARYDLHPIVQQYALSYFADDGYDETAARDRHCEFYLTLLRDREKAVKGVGQHNAIRELADEMDNIRTAWSWAIKRGKYEAIGPALGCVGLLYDIRGLRGEGLEQIEMLVQSLRTDRESIIQQTVLGQALAQQGMLTFRLGQYDRAAGLLEESLVILRPTGDPVLLMPSLVWFSVLLCLSGELERASPLVDEVIACAQLLDDTWSEAHGLFARGSISYSDGRYSEAYEEEHAGLALYRRIGDLHFTAMALNFMVLTLVKLEYYEEAHICLDESLALCTQIDDRWGMGTAYCQQGLVALAEGQLTEARNLFDRSARIYIELDARWDLARAYIFTGDTALAAGDYSEARCLYENTLPLALEVRAMPLVLDVFIGLARCYLARGEAEKALELLAFGADQVACTPETMQRLEPVQAAAMAELGPDIVADVQSGARHLTIEQIALGVLNKSV